MTALTGPSGRGKSTLLYLLGLMLTPASGQVTIDGTPASQLPDSSRASLRAHQFGFVFQDAALDTTRTVLDNITEGALYRGQERSRFLERAKSLMAQLEVDVDPWRRPGQVSGGQAQRIAVCRALLGDPRIVLADEPTGNLDEFSTNAVVDALRSQAEHGAAVIVVTHSEDVAAKCDERIHL